MIIGEGAAPEVISRIRDVLAASGGIGEVRDLRTLHSGRRTCWSPRP
ncbi:hypothetical protein [Spongiactinospora sp. TRM90649]|nr:hypothetical protein [Spongiactinospora sp. TRM90649]MDF5757795.1 hypothetical protein [Spongiactinospora sp. TRM90649]